MTPVAVWLSIVLHIVVLTLSYFNLDNFTKRTVLKDNGHAVFDFITIGHKSKAPVLSPINSRASRQKSHSDEKIIPNTINDKHNKTTEISKNNDQRELHKETTVKDLHPKSENKPNKILTPQQKKQKSKNDNNSKQAKSKSAKKKENKKSGSVKHMRKDNNQSATKTKRSSKISDNALVNLSNKKKKSSELASGAKGAFDSVVDSALADGNYENSGLNADEVGDTLTATQVDLIRETIRPCWHFPAGLKDADKLAVDIKMELDPDGYVKSANVVDKSRMISDTGFRTAAESALRAVLDPVCNPLPLPKDKYNEWKDLELTFNPKDWT